MLKTSISIKQLKNQCRCIYKAGFCELQDILEYTEPQYYNSGVNGWNCDIYYSPEYDIAIVTGYRNLIGNKIPDELLNKYRNIIGQLNYKYREGDISFTELVDSRKNFVHKFYRELQELWFDLFA